MSQMSDLVHSCSVSVGRVVDSQERQQKALLSKDSARSRLRVEETTSELALLQVLKLHDTLQIHIIDRSYIVLASADVGRRRQTNNQLNSLLRCIKIWWQCRLMLFEPTATQWRDYPALWRSSTRERNSCGSKRRSCCCRRGN